MPGSVLHGQILAFPNDYLVSVKVRTIEMSMPVCLCPCACVKNKMYKLHQIFIAVAVSRSSSAGISIYYILLVLWMTSCLPIISLIQNQLAGSLRENHQYWHMLIQCDVYRRVRQRHCLQSTVLPDDFILLQYHCSICGQ